MNTCDIKVYTNIGSMYYDFNLNEKNIDSIIDLLQKNQLDENISLDGLDKMSLHFQSILNNHLVEEKFDHHTFLSDLIKYGVFSSESIAMDLQKLNSVTEVWTLITLITLKIQ